MYLRLMIVFSLLLLVGCGTDDRYMSTEPPIDLAKTQLTLEVWNQMTEGPEKYDPELMKRLHREEPTLQSAEAWKKFQNEVVKPGTKKALGK